MKVAVFCGATIGNSEEYKKTTMELGKWIIDNQHDLVYGGGNVGLMGLIADTVLEGDREVHGIIPGFLVDRELAKNDLTTLQIVENMSIRKRKMIELAEVYIALPGGPGTLEEISEVISWGRVGEHSNPCILINHNGYYNDLKNQYQKMVENGFLNQEENDKVLFADSINELNDFINNFSPIKIRSYK